MTIRFGVSPIAWANDDMPELGGETPLETILAETRDIGFEGVELGGKFPRDPAVLKPLLARYGLDLIGGWYSGSLLAQDAKSEIAALQAHLRLLKAMGSNVFVFAETSNAVHGARHVPLTAAPRLTDWERFGARLTQVAHYVKGAGLHFAYHHHLGTVVEDAGDIEAFLRSTGSEVGLTLDTGHAVLGGIDPVEIIRRHPARVVHVHCKDVRIAVHHAAKLGAKSFLDGVLDGMFTVPGDGAIDFAAIMRELQAIEYSGWIVVEAEQNPAIANPKLYQALGLATLKREAAAAGLIREAA